MINKENIINFEVMGGWPVQKMTIRDILKEFGAELKTNRGNLYWEIPESKTLDLCPLLLEDDGMGYGVNEQYVTDVHVDEKNGYCTMFRESKLEYIEEWLDAGIYPGELIKIDEKSWFVRSIEKEGDSTMFVCEEWLYEHETDETCGKTKFELGEEKKFSIDEIKKYYGREVQL